MTLLNENTEKAGITSVLMPLYNHASTVEKSLNSILLSDCSKIELIICDDTSSDQSFEIASLWIEENRNKFESVHAVKNPINLGINKNLNKLISLAFGEFITFFASDDELTHEAIDKQKLYLVNNPQNDFVYSNCGLINQRSQIISDKLIENWRAKVINQLYCSIVDLVSMWGVTWSRIYARREPFKKFGEIPEHLSFEDRWCALKIAQTKRFGYLHEVVYLYRIRELGTGTAGVNPNTILKDMVLVERMAFKESSGLLKILLFVRINSYFDPNCPSKIRFHWLLLRKLIRLFHCAIILGPL